MISRRRVVKLEPVVEPGPVNPELESGMRKAQVQAPAPTPAQGISQIRIIPEVKAIKQAADYEIAKKRIFDAPAPAKKQKTKIDFSHLKNQNNKKGLHS